MMVDFLSQPLIVNLIQRLVVVVNNLLNRYALECRELLLDGGDRTT